jgi:hypothetical protein
MHVRSDSGIQKEEGIKGKGHKHEANAQGRKIKKKHRLSSAFRNGNI